MTGKELIKKILDYGVDREVLVQRGRIDEVIKDDDVIVDENAKIVIKDW